MFSGLPDDSLLEIFSYLNEEDLHEMNIVNQRMYKLAHYQLKKNNDRRAGELRIVESEFGHAFHLFYPDTQVNYVYHIEKGENECSSRTCCFCGPKETRKSFKGFRNVEYQQLLHFQDNTIASCNKIPSVLTCNLGNFLLRHSFTGVVLKNIRINSSFLDFLEHLLRKARIMCLFGVKVDDDCIERFCVFDFEHNLQFMYMKHSRSVSEAFMYEHYFGHSTKMSAEELFSLLAIVIEGVFPSSDTVGYQFSNDRFFSLISSPASCIPMYLEEKMQTRESDMLILGVTDVPSVWSFDEFPHLKLYPNEGADFSLGIPSHLLEDTRNGARISFLVYNVENEYVLNASWL